MIDDLPPLREVVARHGLDARKALGQNFLYDLNLTSRIARAAGPIEGVTVVEIGPGPGGLTRALLAHGARRVIVIERDPRCLPALEEISERYPGRLVVIEGNALALDLPALVQAHGSTDDASGALKNARICANLPYNIATTLLAGWLEAEPWPSAFDRYVLMFQREVAERIVATPRQRVDYGRLGVLCGWRTKARILFDIPPSAFTPPPKVVSSVVELIPNPAPLDCNRKLLSLVTQAAFGQRRKMLRQSLKGLGVDPTELLSSTGMEPTRRAEEIDIDGFVALARALESLRVTP